MGEADYIQYPIKELLAKVASDQDKNAERWEEKFDEIAQQIHESFGHLDARLRVLEAEKPLSVDRVRRFEELEREVPKLRALAEMHRHEGHPDISRRLEELQKSVHDLSATIGSIQEVSNFKRWSLGLGLGAAVSIALAVARLVGGH